MLPLVLQATGLVAAIYGSWRGYVAARAALLPLAREGEPTRVRLEAAQPLHQRGRVRLAARNVLRAVGWLAVAMYGLYLVTVGLTVAP